MNKITYILFLSLALFSCEFSADERPVLAQVYDFTLYEDELESIMPVGLSKSDSLFFLHDYINQWTHNRVILHKAMSNDNNLLHEDEEIEKRLEEYRNSLIIYKYTQRLIEQKLDTNVDYEEIEAYYEEHKREFTLKDDIVQVAFVKFSLQSKNLKQVRELLKKYTEEDQVKLRNIAEDKAVNYFLDDNTWILFDDLVKEVPLQTYNKSLYLKNNQYIEVEDSLYSYMLRVNNYRIQDNLSPLSFEYDRIRSVIINIRKMELIERMKRDVFQEAQKNGAIEISI